MLMKSEMLMDVPTAKPLCIADHTEFIVIRSLFILRRDAYRLCYQLFKIQNVHLNPQL